MSKPCWGLLSLMYLVSLKDGGCVDRCMELRLCVGGGREL